MFLLGGPSARLRCGAHSARLHAAAPAGVRLNYPPAVAVCSPFPPFPRSRACGAAPTFANTNLILCRLEFASLTLGPCGVGQASPCPQPHPKAVSAYVAEQQQAADTARVYKRLRRPCLCRLLAWRLHPRMRCS